MLIKSCLSVAAMTAFTGLAVSTASANLTIPTVTIGNPGNAADPTTGLGAVSYTYNIGTTEVTNAQYAAFLNAVAASDPFNLYNPNMAGSFGGIIRSGSAGSYTYNTVSGRANNPVNYVSFWDAARFANWLHNGQGNGSTETGAYTLTPDGISANTISRNAGWQWAVASENEWYKAAYFQPASAGGDSDNYWLYPTSSNSVPTTAQANFGSAYNNLTPVGSFAPNYYGAFDMGGNVFEWTETTIGSLRRTWGGGFTSGVGVMSTVASFFGAPGDLDSGVYGFRVVQIPGPSSVALLAIGGLMTARRRR